MLGSLQIRRSIEDDEGNYECVAENSVGLAISYASNLYVRGEYTPRHVRKAEARLTGKVSFRTEILERAQTDKFCDCKLSVSEYEAD